MKFVGKDIIMIDIETSGLNYDKDEIIKCTAMILPYSGNASVVTKYGKPKEKLSTEMEEFIGITNKDLNEAIPSSDLKKEIKDLIKDKIVVTAYKDFLQSFLGVTIETCFDTYTFNLYELKKPKYDDYLNELSKKFNKEEIKSKDVQIELKCDYKSAYLIGLMLNKKRKLNNSF